MSYNSWCFSLCQSLLISPLGCLTATATHIFPHLYLHGTTAKLTKLRGTTQSVVLDGSIQLVHAILFLALVLLSQIHKQTHLTKKKNNWHPYFLKVVQITHAVWERKTPQDGSYWSQKAANCAPCWIKGEYKAENSHFLHHTLMIFQMSFMENNGTQSTVNKKQPNHRKGSLDSFISPVLLIHL